MDSEKSEYDDSSSTEDISLALRHNADALAAPTALTTLGAHNGAGNIQLSSQANSLFYLSLIEAKCNEQALKTLNTGRDADDHLPGSHPDVQKMARGLFKDMAAELQKSGVLPRAGELAAQQFAGLRESYLSTFDNILENVATRIARDHGANNSLSIRSSQSSFGQYSLDQLQRSTIMAPRTLDPFSSDALTTNPFQYRSTYHREWQQIGLLGKGGFGAVYRVRHKVDEQEYAIKKVIITPEQLRTLDTKALLSEVRALAQHKHPNVVNYYGCWIELGQEIIPSERRLLDAEESTSVSMTTSEIEVSEDRFALEDDASMSFGGLREDMEKELDKDRRRQRRSTMTEESFSKAGISFGISTSTSATTSEIQFSEDDDIQEDEDNAIIPTDNRARILYIRFTVYPLTLEEYISTDPPKPDHEFPIRHCFHTIPSIRILSAILNGVQYLHAKRMIHRDLKPANIFLSAKKSLEAFCPSHDLIDVSRQACATCSGSAENNQAYITPCIGDLGLAVELKDSNTPSSSSYLSEFKPTNLSRLGSRQAGTTLYCPPKRSVVCPKLDVYALGVIALELIMPFTTKSERGIVLSGVREGKFPRDFEKHEMAEGIKMMICPDRDVRWGCEDVRRWLESFG
ncbi:PEK kinase protein [Rutstroemia sp. NJR-2017a BBW]|nr:PEK kinase protein [Rutstroemia sp. NJR-2017a BBW]